MKNSTLFIAIIAVNLFFNTGCDKTASEQPFEKCNLGGNLISIEDKIGELVFTDTISGFRFSQKEYFIKNYGIDSINLSLKPCNLPAQFKNTSLNSSIAIKFSGKIQQLPSTVDASSLNFEFSKIELLNKI